jgi:cytidylate kinase
MSIITISRGSYSQGKEVAERVAQRLGYECVAREVLLEASEQFNIPEAKLLMTIKNAPSILDRFTYGREKYIAYIQAAILKHFQKDNVVYHGMAGHFFVKGIPHVLKVRIIADMNNRVRVVMERDGISAKEALRTIKKLDDDRLKWSRLLYGIDTGDPNLYDLVLHIQKLTVEDAADIICHTVNLKHFRTTSESQVILDDLVLAAQVKATFINLKPDIQVVAKNGVVSLFVEAHTAQDVELVQEIKQMVGNLPGLKELKIDIIPSINFSS